MIDPNTLRTHAEFVGDFRKPILTTSQRRAVIYAAVDGETNDANALEMLRDALGDAIATRDVPTGEIDALESAFMAIDRTIAMMRTA